MKNFNLKISFCAVILCGAIFSAGQALALGGTPICDATLTLNPEAGNAPFCADTEALTEVPARYAECSNGAKSICVDRVFIDSVVNTGTSFSITRTSGLTVTVTGALFKIEAPKWIYLSDVADTKIDRPTMDVELLSLGEVRSFVDFRSTSIGKVVAGIYTPGANNVTAKANDKINSSSVRIIAKNSVIFQAKISVRFFNIVIDEPVWAGTGVIIKGLGLAGLDAKVERVLGGVIINSPDPDLSKKENGDGGPVTIKATAINVGNIITDGKKGKGGQITLYGASITTGNLSLRSVRGWSDKANPAPPPDTISWFDSSVYGESGKLEVLFSAGFPTVEYFRSLDIIAQGKIPQNISIAAYEMVETKNIYNFNGNLGAIGSTPSWGPTPACVVVPSCDYSAQSGGCSVDRPERRKCPSHGNGGMVSLRGDDMGVRVKGNIVTSAYSTEIDDASHAKGYVGAGVAGVITLTNTGRTTSPDDQDGVYIEGNIEAVGFQEAAAGFNFSANSVQISGKNVWLGKGDEGQTYVTTDNVDVPAFPDEIAVSANGGGDGMGKGAGAISIAAKNNLVLYSGLRARGQYHFAPNGGMVNINVAYDQINGNFIAAEKGYLWAGPYANQNWIYIDTSGASFYRSKFDSGSPKTWAVIDGEEGICDDTKEVIDGTDAGKRLDGWDSHHGDGTAGGDGGPVSINAKTAFRKAGIYQPNLNITAIGGRGNYGGTAGQGRFCKEYVSTPDAANPPFDTLDTTASIHNIVPASGIGGEGGNGGNGGNVGLNIQDVGCFYYIFAYAKGGEGGQRGVEGTTAFSGQNIMSRSANWLFAFASRTGSEYMQATGIPWINSSSVLIKPDPDPVLGFSPKTEVWESKYYSLQGWQGATVPDYRPPSKSGRGGQGGNITINNPQPVDTPVQALLLEAQGADAGNANNSGQSYSDNYPKFYFQEPNEPQGTYVTSLQAMPYPFYCSSTKTDVVTVNQTVQTALKTAESNANACVAACAPTYTEPCMTACSQAYDVAAGNATYEDPMCCSEWSCLDLFTNAGGDCIYSRNCYSELTFNNTCRPKVVQTPCQTKGFTAAETHADLTGYTGGPLKYYYRASTSLADPNPSGLSITQAKYGAFNGQEGNFGGRAGSIFVDSRLAHQYMDLNANGGKGNPGTSGQMAYVDIPGEGGNGGAGGDASQISTTRVIDAARIKSAGGAGGIGGQPGTNVFASLIGADDFCVQSHYWWYSAADRAEWLYPWMHIGTDCSSPLNPADKPGVNCCRRVSGTFDGHALPNQAGTISAQNGPHLDWPPFFGFQWYASGPDPVVYGVKLSRLPLETSGPGTNGAGGVNATPIGNVPIHEVSVDPDDTAGGLYVCQNIPPTAPTPLPPTAIWDPVSESGNCCDGLDNDNDGLIDCQDPDCFNDCYTNNTGKGYLIRNGTDCRLPDANCHNPSNPACCERGAVCAVDICNDIFDNDLWADGVDFFDTSSCQFCGNGAVDAGETCDGGNPWDATIADAQCLPGAVCAPAGQAGECACGGANGAPTATPNAPQQIGGCDVQPTVRFSWVYNDPDGDPQASFQLQVFNAGGTKIFDISGGADNQRDIALSGFGEQYTWKIKVTDGNGGDSGFQNGNPTKPSRWPRPGFNCDGEDCNTNTFDIAPHAVQFCSVAGGSCVPTFTTCYDTNNNSAACSAWNWDFDYIVPLMDSDSVSQNPTHGYAAAQTYRVRLEVTDQQGRVCSTEHNVPMGVVAPIGPKWWEITPF